MEILQNLGLVVAEEILLEFVKGVLNRLLFVCLIYIDWHLLSELAHVGNNRFIQLLTLIPWNKMLSIRLFWLLHDISFSKLLLYSLFHWSLKNSLSDLESGIICFLMCIQLCSLIRLGPRMSLNWFWFDLLCSLSHCISLLP